jgi:hypothetical protein
LDLNPRNAGTPGLLIIDGNPCEGVTWCRDAGQARFMAVRDVKCLWGPCGP